MRKKLERLVLLALNACDGLPMPEDSLVAAVQVMSRPETPTRSDVLDAIKAAEVDGFAQGANDALTSTTWTLTTKGTHKARQL